MLDDFDDPSIESPLCGAEDMASWLRDIHNSGGRIVLLPDFDMDGIMSGVLGFSALAELGFNAGLHMLDPSRGYGIWPRDIGELLTAYPDTKAILTADVGISCTDAVAAAKAKGLTVLVTDHHKPIAGALPPADCVVDPMLPEDPYRHKSICGAHVLYQVLLGYARRYAGSAMEEQIRRLRVFAGIGTVSDAMPLAYENRQIVRDACAIASLAYCGGSRNVVDFMPGSPAYRAAFRGLHEVLRLLADKGKIQGGRVDEDLFGFYMAPMFNSVKRMNGSLRAAYDAFFGTDPARSAAYLYGLNKARREEVAARLEGCLLREQPYAPYIYFSDAEAGILGLLAQRLKDQSGEPTCVIREDRLHGSGRSPDWYPFLERCGRVPGVGCAGHEGAFGVSFDDEKAVERLHGFLSTSVPAEAAASIRDSRAEAAPDFVIAQDGSGDTTIDIFAFYEYLDELERFRPFGKGFPPPRVELRLKPDEAEWKTIGGDRQHLKLTMAHGLDVLLWDQAGKIKWAEECRGQTLRVTGQLGVSTFRDQETMNFTGTMIRPAQPAASAAPA